MPTSSSRRGGNEAGLEPRVQSAPSPEDPAAGSTGLGVEVEGITLSFGVQTAVPEQIIHKSQSVETASA